MWITAQGDDGTATKCLSHQKGMQTPHPGRSRNMEFFGSRMVQSTSRAPGNGQTRECATGKGKGQQEGPSCDCDTTAPDGEWGQWSKPQNKEHKSHKGIDGVTLPHEVAGSEG